MSFTDLITHIIIEDTNRKAIQAAKAKETAVKANLVEDKPHSKKYDSKYKKKQKQKQKQKNAYFANILLTAQTHQKGRNLGNSCPICNSKKV